MLNSPSTDVADERGCKAHDVAQIKFKPRGAASNTVHTTRSGYQDFANPSAELELSNKMFCKKAKEGFVIPILVRRRVYIGQMFAKRYNSVGMAI